MLMCYLSAVDSWPRGVFLIMVQCRELQLQDLNSTLGSVSEPDCGEILTFVLISLK